MKTEWRSETGIRSKSVQGPVETPGTVEVMRANGELKSFYYDLNGERILLHSTRDFFTGPIFVGLAVTSGTTDGSIAEAEFNEIEETSIPFSITRTLPRFEFNPGEAIENITLDAGIDDGATVNLSITENPPEG